jgi:hypothetical protein
MLKTDGRIVSINNLDALEHYDFSLTVLKNNQSPEFELYFYLRDRPNKAMKWLGMDSYCFADIVVERMPPMTMIDDLAELFSWFPRTGGCFIQTIRYDEYVEHVEPERVKLIAQILRSLYRPPPPPPISPLQSRIQKTPPVRRALAMAKEWDYFAANEI